MNRRVFLFIVIVVIFIASFFVAGRLKRNINPSINLSGLTLKDLNGNKIIVSQFIKKPGVVNLMILVLQQFLSHAFMLPMKNFLQQKMALWQKKI
jgi:predicted transcriptional regulator